MNRNLETLIRRVREELRAEGPDGAGYSDFSIVEAFNSAMYNLAEEFPVKDTITFTTVEDTGEYSLDEVIGDVEFENIIRVLYDGKQIRGIALESFFATENPSEGPVEQWVFWGDRFILVGKVEAEKEVKMYITRAPKKLMDKDDVPETPYYADEALAQYAIAACYRESRDYERANFHYGIFLRLKDSILRRGTPQAQREHRVTMRDSYWGPVRDKDGMDTSDTNPGGRVD